MESYSTVSKIVCTFVACNSNASKKQGTARYRL